MREESLVASGVGVRVDPTRFAVDWQTTQVDRPAESAGPENPERDVAIRMAAHPDAWVGEWALS